MSSSPEAATRSAQNGWRTADAMRAAAEAAEAKLAAVEALAERLEAEPFIGETSTKIARDLRGALASVGRTEPKGHHRDCFQTRGVPQSLLDEGAPANLCDCKILWVLEAREGEAGWTCPTECVSLNHPGQEHGQWVAIRLASGHDCSTCTDCIHDGRRCCGCYDGACCKSPEWATPADV